MRLGEVSKVDEIKIDETTKDPMTSFSKLNYTLTLSRVTLLYRLWDGWVC